MSSPVFRDVDETK